MFTRIQPDESSYPLGIIPHRHVYYTYETPFFAGNASHTNTNPVFNLNICPNYAALQDMSPGDYTAIAAIKAQARGMRGQEISAGKFPTLDTVQTSLLNIQQWYTTLLKSQGAAGLFLIDRAQEGFRLIPDPEASDVRFGDVIKAAASAYAFEMVADNRAVPFAYCVGKIMPVFFEALGLKEYYLKVEPDSNYGDVTFILDEVACFRVLDQGIGKPAYMERYGYRNGDYYRNFHGETKGDFLKTIVFDWLRAAAMERELEVHEDVDSYLQELASDIRRTWIARAGDKTLLDRKKEAGEDVPAPGLFTGENVIEMGRKREGAGPGNRTGAGPIGSIAEEVFRQTAAGKTVQPDPFSGTGLDTGEPGKVITLAEGRRKLDKKGPGE